MLSIVILTYNGQKYIQACLNSIFNQATGDLEVIVVDNASTDGTKELIKTNYPQVRLIENLNNLGASKARNQGIEASTGEWVLALDSDVVLEQNFFHVFNAEKEKLGGGVGMIQPDVLNTDGQTIYSQGIILTAFRRFYDLGRGKPKSFVPPKPQKIIGPCSAAAFYRRSMLDQLKETNGYFDERFFFLVEDVDLAWRAKRAGWKVLFCSRLVCSHKGDSSNTNRKLRQYLCFRNRRWMIKKNESCLGRFRVFLISLPYEVSRVIYLAVSNKYFWKNQNQ